MPSPIYLQRTNPPPTTTTSSSAATTASCTTAAAQKTQLQPTTRYITPISTWVPDHVLHHHTHPVGPNQCCSAVVQTTAAPIDSVWSLLRRFDNPQSYKHFLKSCNVIFGDGYVGSLREVQVVSGLPAGSSKERLEVLDDEKHVMSFRVVGGDHRLKNYKSVTTLHHTRDQNEVVVVESYVVDVPQGNTKEETVVFVDTIVRCNLQSLAHLAESQIN